MFDEDIFLHLLQSLVYWKDDQVPNTYSHYADIAMETLLLLVQPIMEKQTG
jgi:hypothetical protein